VQWPPAEAPVRIGAGSWLATGVTVLPGADIGRHVTVGAGAVVRGQIPDNTVVVGMPARVVRSYDPASNTWN
jgi:acetyltransferase-like isoleucine patch superfamily enzyme